MIGDVGFANTRSLHDGTEKLEAGQCWKGLYHLNKWIMLSVLLYATH